MVVGTPGFTAPERVRGDAATAASDLWSLGATLYATVEGRGPFERAGGADAVTLGVAKEEAPSAPSARLLGPVLDALLRRDPAARPDAATAGRLLAEAAATTADAPLVAILEPPVFAELCMPRLPDLADDLGILAGHDASMALTAITDQKATANVGGAELAADSAVQHPDSDAAGPVLWQPLKPTSGRTGGWSAAGDAAGAELAADAGARLGLRSTGSGDGRWRRRQDERARGRPSPTGSAEPLPRGPRHGRWRLLFAAGVAAIGAAVIAGWYLYNGTQTSRAIQSPGAPVIAVRGSSGPGNDGSGANGNQPAAGASALTVSSKSKGGDGPSSATSGAPGATSMPNRSASPPGPQAPVLPPGYVWHRFTTAVMGTAAGFEIGLPSAWQQSVTALSAQLNQLARNFYLTVNLRPWLLVGPLAQARHLASLAAKTDAGYRQLSLGLIGFRAVGGFKAAPAAELEFRWTNGSAGSMTELVILVTLTTKAGPQPYTFTLTAPTARFGSAGGIFYTAMPTFRPLPG